MQIHCFFPSLNSTRIIRKVKNILICHAIESYHLPCYPINDYPLFLLYSNAIPYSWLWCSCVTFKCTTKFTISPSVRSTVLFSFNAKIVQPNVVSSNAIIEVSVKKQRIECQGALEDKCSRRRMLKLAVSHDRQTQSKDWSKNLGR